MVHEGQNWPGFVSLAILSSQRMQEGATAPPGASSKYFCTAAAKSLLWAAREGGLDGSHLLPREDNSELPHWGHSCAEFMIPVPSVPEGSATDTSLGTYSNSPSLCTPWSPPGRNLTRNLLRNLPTFILLALLSVYPHQHGFQMEEAANFDMNSIVAKIKVHKLWRESEYKEFHATSVKRQIIALPLHLTSNISTSINENNSPVATTYLDFNHQVLTYLPAMPQAPLSNPFFKLWSKSPHKQLCPCNAILLRFSTTSKIVAKWKCSGVMTGKAISWGVCSASVCSLK